VDLPPVGVRSRGDELRHRRELRESLGAHHGAQERRETVAPAGGILESLVPGEIAHAASDGVDELDRVGRHGSLNTVNLVRVHVRVDRAVAR
jgi:hypothetical protein